ncbi:uncharacterized protein LOC122084669 isoform X2 [Macadamia integrifolia]|uniref:uncharacterized protein LOC122084669 isoform X2 n=1 Tax=Macadamia integrifolia TaxID=60698 RepID=UPI001C4FBEBE|nr:uncharacterized protein LOC122084669 isoform X2 [Macadamia integrifolia]
MGALAPIAPWIPEDDILLKNAVEAGASLESLAKGAVRFSRRFTIRELQDRWHSLLYDPYVSAEASDRMVQIEGSASNLSSRPNRSDNSKGSGCTSEKKNVGSVRSHYYAMRKRICSEPFNPFDISFFVAPGNFNCTGNEDGCQEQLTHQNEPESQNCMFGEPISNHFGLPESDLDIVHHALPMVGNDTTAGDIDGSADAFHSGHLNSFEGGLPDGMIGRSCLYGFTGDVSPVSVKDAAQTGIGHSFEHNNVHKDVPLQQDVPLFGNCPGAQEMGPQRGMPVSDLFKTDHLEAKPLSTFDSINNNPGNVCSGFGVSQCFGSAVSDCSDAFHRLGYSSTLARMPSWEPIDGISKSAMQIEANLVGDKGQVPGDAVAATGDGGAEKIGSSGYEIVHSEPNLEERISTEGLTNSTAMPEGDFMDLSSSLLNFADDGELLFMDVDVKDMMDRSGLNSILLNSPGESHQDDLPGIPTESRASESQDTCLMVANDLCTGEFDDLSYQSHFRQNDGHKVCDAVDNQLVSTSAPNPHSPELQNGVICCILSTEDPKIPDNDDIFPSTEMLTSVGSLIMQQSSWESANIAASFPMDIHDAQKVSERGSNLVKGEKEALAQRLLVDACGFKSELPESGSAAVESNHISASSGEFCQCRPVPITPNFVPDGSLKESTGKVEMQKQHDFHCPVDSLLDKPGHGSDHVKSCPQNIFGGCNQEADVSIAIHKNLQSHGEPSSMEATVPEPGISLPTSDHEEQLSESDGDVPYFSDVEAMILDMDLGPDDRESYFSRKVLRYQNKDTKRAIIRLEQVVQSHMQRAMASHRAFAIFYGRHLKHYIKKPEVLLGRATNDVDVDIDLGREGRADKISRRQAMIKMDEDGSFYLKNLGKCPILVNSKEVANGQRLSLNSCCLIEASNIPSDLEERKKESGRRRISLNLILNWYYSDVR